MNTGDSLKRYLQAIPKAELHVHLEGSIQPETLLTLARRNGVQLPVQTVEEMQNWFRFRDFNHFVEIYVAITRCLKTAEDYELITYELGATLARQQVRYAEVTFSASIHEFTLGVPFDVYFTGLTRGRTRLQREFGIEFQWVFDIVRNIQADRKERADYTVAVAIEGMRDGVVALGLGGAEMDNPPELFASWFDRARAAGLHSAPHAGETVGPASVWGALRSLGAERIGHGVRAIEDPSLVTYLAQQQVPLEVCPTSNICLSVYPSLGTHPLPQLYAAGVPLTVNSDDPPLFNTTLQHEVDLLADPFRLDVNAIDEIVLNGVRHCFLPVERKRSLEQAFRMEIARLRDEVDL